MNKPKDSAYWDEVVTIILYNDEDDDGPRSADKKKQTLIALFDKSYNLDMDIDISSMGEKCQDPKENQTLQQWYQSAKLDNFIFPLYIYQLDNGKILLGCEFIYPFTCLVNGGQVGYILMPHNNLAKTNLPVIKEEGRKICVQEIDQINRYYHEGAFSIMLVNMESTIIDRVNGFYGFNIEANGMKQYIPLKLHYLLATATEEFMENGFFWLPS